MTLKISNKREANFCWGYICRMFNIFIENPKDYKEIRPLTLSLLEQNNIKDKNKIINDINSLSEQYVLNENELTFLTQSNERFINWFWCKLVLSKSIYKLNKSLDSQYPFPEPGSLKEQNQTNNEDIFNIYRLNTSPYSTIEKKEIIITFIDLINLSRTDKITIINKIKNNWLINEELERFNWIDSNNEKLCEWALNYTNEYAIKNNHSLPYIGNINIDNYYSKFLLVFDLWEAHNDTKKLFITSIKKALSQKKHREKQKDKKQCSFNLSEKNIIQLALLSEHQGKPKNHILESLINSKYQELINSNK